MALKKSAIDKVGPEASLFVRLAAVWLALGILEIGLSTAIPGAGLRDQQLSIAARFSLIGFGLVLLLIGTCVVALLLRPAFYLSRARAGRWFGIGYRAIVIWLAVLLWVASWITFWQTGRFLDRDALAFWSANPIQMFHWVYPPLIVAFFLASSGLAWLVGYFIPKRVSTRAPATQHRLMRLTGGVLTACILLAVGGGIAGVWKHLGQSTSPLSGGGIAHAGPIAHALFDSYRRATVFAEPPRENSDDTLRVLHHPLIEMQDYISRVDKGRQKRLNVLMIQVESLRSDQLRAYGGRRDVMPTIDALAKEARVFTRGYIQASHSDYADPVPLSSHYPLRSRESYSYPENPTYPRVFIYDILKALGYRTAVFSSQNEYWGGMINYYRLSTLDRFFHAQTFNGPTISNWQDTGFAEWVKKTKGAGSVDDRYTVTEAIEWISSSREQPFFVHMNLQSSHLPYYVPPDFHRRFGGLILDVPIEWGKFPREMVDAVKDRYADSLFYMDTQIARLFDALKQYNLWDDTIIVIGGDNGEAFYEHGFSAHASWLFDEVVRVPMIIRVPGMKPGFDDRPAMFLDVPPSLLDVLGLPPHPSFQGISLFAPVVNSNRSIFIIAQSPMAYETAIVRGNFKLHWLEREDQYLLYDIVKDPGETTNISGQHPDVVNQLSNRIHQWRREQIDYYDDVARQAREYPPYFED